MAKTLNSKMKLCKVMTNGPIMELGGITGPILYPCRLDLRKVINMVHHGIRVIEVNPKNHKETIELNIQNVSLNNFPDKPKYKMPEETKKKETPVVAKEKDIVTTKQDNIITNTIYKNNSVSATLGLSTSISEDECPKVTLAPNSIPLTQELIELTPQEEKNKYEKNIKNDFHSKKHKK